MIWTYNRALSFFYCYLWHNILLFLICLTSRTSKTNISLSLLTTRKSFQSLPWPLCKKSVLIRFSQKLKFFITFIFSHWLKVSHPDLSSSSCAHYRVNNIIWGLNIASLLKYGIYFEHKLTEWSWNQLIWVKNTFVIIIIPNCRRHLTTHIPICLWTLLIIPMRLLSYLNFIL